MCLSNLFFRVLYKSGNLNFIKFIFKNRKSLKSFVKFVNEIRLYIVA